MPPTYIPFETPPAMAQWDRPITHQDYNKMLKGCKPKSMEDKWNIKMDAPEDAQGNAILHLYFGWTPREEFSLDIVAGDPNKTEAKEWARIVKISWKVDFPGGLTVDEEEAKTVVIRLCNNLLGCTIEDEDDYDYGDEDEDEDEVEDKHKDKEE
jgi:hypothetical protein